MAKLQGMSLAKLQVNIWLSYRYIYGSDTGKYMAKLQGKCLAKLQVNIWLWYR
jgi:hypothetical protein